MSALMEMLTARRQLTAADRREAYFEGRQFAKEVDEPSRRGPSAAQAAFAHRSLAHMAIAIFMGNSTRDELRRLHDGMRTGTDNRLARPLPYVADSLRSIGWNERREAWRLFGQGLRL